MGTVARPLSAEQELATQQSSTSTPASKRPHCSSTSPHHRNCVTKISTTTPATTWTLLRTSIPLASTSQQQPRAPRSPPRVTLFAAPLPSDPVIGMLHPSIFLASSLLLAHSHGDLQPSKLHHDSSEARLLQVTSGGNIRGGPLERSTLDLDRTG